jgi:hypothetical protein
MATLASDNFDRADNTNVGSDWTEVSGDWAISGNKLTKTATFGQYEIITWDTTLNASPSADYDVEAVVNTVSVDYGEPRVIARYIDVNNFYFLNCNLFANELHLFKIVGGTESSLGSYSVDLNSDTNYTIKINGTERISATDSSLTETGKPALQNDLGGPDRLYFNNFAVYGTLGVLTYSSPLPAFRQP